VTFANLTHMVSGNSTDWEQVARMQGAPQQHGQASVVPHIQAAWDALISRQELEELLHADHTMITRIVLPLGMAYNDWQRVPRSITLRQLPQLEAFSKRGLRIINYADVSSYLTRHTDMLRPLEDVLTQAQKVFCEVASLYLQLHQDYEADQNYLVMYVRQPDYNQEFLAKLESMWDIVGPMFETTSGWLLFTSDFRSP